jgi:hypothetical protein
LIEFLVQTIVNLRSRTSISILIIENGILAEGQEELQEILQMVNLTLSNFLSRDMIEIVIKHHSYNIDNALNLLPRAEVLILTQLEYLDHHIREQNLGDLEVDLLLPKALNLVDPSLDSHILEDVHHDPYDVVFLLAVHFIILSIKLICLAILYPIILILLYFHVGQAYIR